MAGALSFLSPCVLPLVPPYLCYMAGVSADDLRNGPAVASAGYARLLGSSVIFVLGFSTVFVALGAGASTIGQLLRQNLDWLGIVAGIAIIVMGLNFLGLFRLSFLAREARLQAPDRPKSLIGAYLMGLAFAFGWTPCIGPVLGAILGLAGARGTVGEGAVMLGFYSAGLGIPFILAAAFSGAFFRWMSSFRRHLDAVEKAMGGLLVVTGVLFLTGGMQSMSFWLLETFPALQTIG
nr:cytochrome c biogenesis protein CcdA [Jiella sp. LLJ827]